MNSQLEGEHTQLLQFLYACPVGLVEIEPEGEIVMINPIAMRLLLPIARIPLIVNFFDIIEAYAPELRNLLDAFEEEHGPICEGQRLVIRPEIADAGRVPKVLSCTLVKLSKERFMVTLTDISKQVDQERRLRQAEAWFASLMDGVNDFAVVSRAGARRQAPNHPARWRATGVSHPLRGGRARCGRPHLADQRVPVAANGF